jgi:hypothetical protein
MKIKDESLKKPGDPLFSGAPGFFSQIDKNDTIGLFVSVCLGLVSTITSFA